MTGLEEFEALFGNVTVASLVELGAGGGFSWSKSGAKSKNTLTVGMRDWLAEEKAKEARERADEERDRKLDKALAAIDKYPRGTGHRAFVSRRSLRTKSAN